MNSDNPEMLPCPFCGTDDDIDPAGVLNGDGTRSPECMGCGATASTVATWNCRIAAPAEDVCAVEDGAVLPELTSDLREILGRPNFTCHFIAKALRLMGFEIPQKSEEEQAVTIYWMLGHYLRDPVNWRDAASAELKSNAPKPEAV
jgi:hypothetical protein